MPLHIADDFAAIAAAQRALNQPREWTYERPSRIAFTDSGAMSASIFLDGIQVFGAVAADAEHGWIDISQVDGKGRLIVNAHGDVATERRRGKVEIYR